LRDAKAEDTQFNSIMSKSLDLAEAGLTLGLNLFQKFGANVQDQLAGKFAKVAEAGKSFVNEAVKTARAQGQSGPGETATRDDEQERSQSAESASAFAGVFNHLPLFPGSPVKVSFSINNETAESVKKVSVKLEGLTGELTGATLDASHFSIKPSKQTLGPMDFEKFVITGTVPPHVRSDGYNGWIIVSGDEQLKIPVKLTITGNG
jgi:hypothetical protein